MLPRSFHRPDPFAGGAHVMDRDKQEASIEEVLTALLGSVGGRPSAAD